MPLGKEIGLDAGDFVLDGDPASPPQKRGGAPPPRKKISAHVYCGQTARWIKMVLGMEVGLSPGDFVLDGDADPSPKREAEPPLQFSAHLHVYCDQTAGCMKMPLGMEVGLGQGDFVFDGDPATPRKFGHTNPTQFLAYVYCGQTAGWTKTPLGTEVDLGSGHIVLEGIPALRERGTAAPPVFSPHVYCGHGRPSWLLLSSCSTLIRHLVAKNQSSGGDGIHPAAPFLHEYHFNVYFPRAPFQTKFLKFLRKYTPPTIRRSHVCNFIPWSSPLASPGSVVVWSFAKRTGFSRFVSAFVRSLTL